MPVLEWPSSGATVTRYCTPDTVQEGQPTSDTRHSDPTDAACHQRLACLVRVWGTGPAPTLRHPSRATRFPQYFHGNKLSSQFLEQTVSCLKLNRCHSVGSRRPRDHASGLTATFLAGGGTSVTGDSARSRLEYARAEPYPHCSRWWSGLGARGAELGIRQCLSPAPGIRRALATDVNVGRDVESARAYGIRNPNQDLRLP
jgi:hypothetical protein